MLSPSPVYVCARRQESLTPLAAGAAAAGPGGLLTHGSPPAQPAAGLLGQLVLPPLLSDHLHLRAAAARLVVLLAEEGLLPGGAAASAPALAAALGLPSLQPWTAHRAPTQGSVGALALCELVAALLEAQSDEVCGGGGSSS